MRRMRAAAIFTTSKRRFEHTMDIVAEAVKAVYDSREETRGLNMVYEPKLLRFFQARFEPIQFR